MSLMGTKSLLIKELLETREFFMLKNAKNEVLTNMEYKSKMSEFQKKQDMLHSRRTRPEDMAKLRDELEYDYRMLSQIPSINRYFMAENAMYNLVGSLFDEVKAAIDINLV